MKNTKLFLFLLLPFFLFSQEKEKRLALVKGNIVFNLLVFKGSDESDLYSRLINEYILAHTNSANRINYFSDKYKIKPSKLKSFIWNEFYGNRNRVSKYIDNSLLKK
jgi:hypothetical protein